MGIEFNYQELDQLLRDFHNITNVKIGMSLPDGRFFRGSGGKQCAFCSIVKSDKHFRDRCEEQDHHALEEAMKGNTQIYICHAGLYESITPIFSRGKPISALHIGQVAPNISNEAAMESLKERLSDHPRFDELVTEYFKMKPRSNDYLESCANIMKSCAGYIYLNNLVTLERSSLFVRLKDYISSNYTKDVSLQDMARELGVCVTTLCTTIRNENNTTPHAMLNSFRMEKARELLKDSALPVNKIAPVVGISDYNYFSRCFKKEMGLSPSQYRKLTYDKHLQSERMQTDSARNETLGIFRFKAQS